MPAAMQWVGAWTNGLVTVDQSKFSNQTLRLIARVSLGGKRLRLRFSNAFGTQKLSIGAVHVGLRDGKTERIVPGSDRSVTFGGETGATIPVGALMVSDPVDLDVPALADLAISLHLPGEIPESLPITGHGNCHQTNYISPPGDFTAAIALPVAATTENWYFLSAIEMLATPETGGIVCFGDSLTEGNLSSLDSNSRWPDQLARRLAARQGRALGVMNQGIGGNRILHEMRGESGLRRFDRDALAQTGATYVILFIGTNDLRNQRGNPAEMINKWIRTGSAFDAVIDFDAALRDPAHPTSMLPAYDCSDHLHPSDKGYRAMGDAIDLGLFT
jgi:lysophospholipase L1-like esterase